MIRAEFHKHLSAAALNSRSIELIERTIRYQVNVCKCVSYMYAMVGRCDTWWSMVVDGGAWWRMEVLGDYALALLLRLVVAPLRRERVLALHAVRLHQLADLILLHKGSVDRIEVYQNDTDNSLLKKRTK